MPAGSTTSPTLRLLSLTKPLSSCLTRVGAAKQRVQIDMKIHPTKTFALATLQSGPLKRDSGTHACNGGDPDDRPRHRKRAECPGWEPEYVDGEIPGLPHLVVAE